MIEIEPIGFVHSSRADAIDDDWDAVSARIELADNMPDESLDGLDTFSHAEILFHFDQVPDGKIERGARHPRGNIEWPKIGILAQRGKNRPNRLGSTVVRVIGREGRTLHVAGLDAIDGTPVIDIKPVMKEFLPRGPVVQPEWSHELMRGYWQ